MRIYYSPSTRGFYLEKIHGKEFPSDSLEVEKDQYDNLLVKQAQGWLIVPDSAGRPCAVLPQASAKSLSLRVNAIYQTRMAAIADGYPLHERESWPVQLEEAKALQADPEAATPWLDACAGARGLDKVELAARVLAKDSAYRLISGTLSGIRQRHEDAIAQLQTVEDANAYDVQAWWPSEEGDSQK